MVTDDYTHLSGLGGDPFRSSRIALRTDSTIAGTHTKSVSPAIMRSVKVSLSMAGKEGFVTRRFEQDEQKDLDHGPQDLLQIDLRSL